MDIDTVRQAAEHANMMALDVAFLAGLVFGFNPVALASIKSSLWPAREHDKFCRDTDQGT